MPKLLLIVILFIIAALLLYGGFLLIGHALTGDSDVGEPKERK